MRRIFTFNFLLLSVVSLLTLNVSVAEAATLTVPKCSLAGRVASGDGVFRIPETVRLDARAFDTVCFVTGSDSREVVATVTTTKDGSFQVVGKTMVSYVAPAMGVTIPAEQHLGAGAYRFQVALADTTGAALAEPYEFSVEVATGEGYAAPEIAEVNAAKEAGIDVKAAEQAALAQSTEKNWFPIAAASVLITLLIALWFFLRRRSIQ